jgi:hypothetical protein
MSINAVNSRLLVGRSKQIDSRILFSFKVI